VIVYKFHVEGIGLFPTEADSVLVVHSNAVLSRSIAGESLKPIPGNRTKIKERRRRMYVVQFAFGHLCDSLEAPAEFAMEDLPGLRIAKRPNHTPEDTTVSR
jgi:hypothetical protein